MNLGFREKRRPGVLFGRNGQTAVRSDPAIRICRTGFRPRRANEIPAQAQVAAWARGRERRAAGRRVRWSAWMGRGSWAECAGARARGQAVGRACAGWAEMVK